MRGLRQTVLLLAVSWPLILLGQNPSKLPTVRQKIVDLHPFGFPTYSNPVATADVRARVFFLDGNYLALYFDRQMPGLPSQFHAYKLLTLNTAGRVLAQRAIKANVDFLDLSNGPGASVILRESEKLAFFDVRLRLVRSHPLPGGVVGMKYDRALEQLVLISSDPGAGNLKASFWKADTFDELATFVYPKLSVVIFGDKELAYALPAHPQSELHVEPDQESWKSLGRLEIFDLLTFVAQDALAFEQDHSLYVVNKDGKRLFHHHIPGPAAIWSAGFVSESNSVGFVGLSDDGSRLAITSQMKRGILASKPGTWPFYNEVFVYNLIAKKLVFEHALHEGYAAALSPDGHQLATIESGSLEILSVP
jgi:hypothetical protein